MSVTFAKGETSYTIRSPERHNVLEKELLQATGRTAGGTFVSYNKGITLQRMQLSFIELTQTEKDNLDSFFETTAEATMNTFTYTDHHGDDWTARFLNRKLPWRERDDAATAGDGIWDVDIELEVTAA